MTNGDNDSFFADSRVAKCEVSGIFFGDNPKTLLAIGNGIDRRSKINKKFPCRLIRTWKNMDIFPKFWVALTGAELNVENILSGSGGFFSRFLSGVWGLWRGSRRHLENVRNSIFPMYRFSNIFSDNRKWGKWNQSAHARLQRLNNQEDYHQVLLKIFHLRYVLFPWEGN